MRSEEFISVSDAEKFKALGKIIRDTGTAFMITHHDGEHFHGRPMANAFVEPDLRAIWFATERDSGKVEEIRENNSVCLGYVNPSGSEWASVFGKASLVDDHAKINELYSPIWKNWFDGPDDPRIILVKVVPESAEYWDTGSKLLSLAKMAFAAVTGAKPTHGTNEVVELRR